MIGFVSGSKKWCRSRTYIIKLIKLSCHQICCVKYSSMLPFSPWGYFWQCKFQLDKTKGISFHLVPVPISSLYLPIKYAKFTFQGELYPRELNAFNCLPYSFSFVEISEVLYVVSIQNLQLHIPVVLKTRKGDTLPSKCQ